MKHYKYGGSTAARTMLCPSWANESEGIPASPSSVFAEVGTRLHDEMEKMLDGDIGQWATKDPDEVILLEAALEAWDTLCIDYGIVDYETEQTFEINADTGGTCDVIATTRDGRTIIVDWKFGQGISVPAEDNKQGLFYAFVSENKVNGYNPNHSLTLAIIQPMPDRADAETLKVWDVEVDIYRDFKRDYISALKRTGLNAGAHCRWCPAAPTCPEKTGAALQALAIDPEKLAILSQSMDLVADLENWLTAVKKLAHERLEQGDTLDGWKLVNKRATRKWVDEAKAEKAIRDIFVKGRKLKVGDITEAGKSV